MRYMLIPDSFKGSMDAQAICEVMSRAILAVDKSAVIDRIPVADGGEGTVDAFLAAMGGERVRAQVRGPFGETVQADYARLSEHTAVVEMAAAAGLPLASGRLDPLLASTYGVGELMRDALQRGARTLLLGLGGSATNDGGCGAAAALGVRFLDETGATFVPTGGTLCRIAAIDGSHRLPQVSGAELRVMCDIDNPLYGETGAAYVFAPQKGADAAMVAQLDEGLRRLAEVIRRDMGVDVSALPGGGAAGGMGAGMVALLGGTLMPGIDLLLDTTRFDERLERCDVVFTGEGRLDSQSLRGKVVVGVGRRARTKRKPVFAFVGGMTDSLSPVYEEGVTAAFCICREPMTLERAMKETETNLNLTVQNLCRTLLCER